MTTREPEWDDWEREKRLAWDIYEAHMCDCGLPESVADEDPDLALHVRRCPICGALAKQMRIMHAEDEKAVKALGKDPDPAAPRPDDGRRIGLRAKAPAQ